MRETFYSSRAVIVHPEHIVLSRLSICLSYICHCICYNDISKFLSECNSFPQPDLLIIGGYNSRIQELSEQISSQLPDVRRLFLVDKDQLSIPSEEQLICDYESFERLQKLASNIIAEQRGNDPERQFEIAAFKSDCRRNLIRIDEKGKIVCSCGIFAELMGIPADKLIGTCIFKLLSPDNRDAFRRDFSESLAGQRVFKQMYRFTPNKGEKVWLEMELYRIPNSSVNINHLLIHYNDLTGKMSILQQYKQTQHRLKMLMENSPNLIIELDPDFNLTELNSSARNFFDIKESLSKKTVYFPSLIPDRWRQEVVCALSGNLQGEKSSMTVKLVSHEPQDQWFDMILSPIKCEDGSVEAILATCWDVSERQSRQREIEENLKIKDHIAQQAQLQKDDLNKRIVSLDRRLDELVHISKSMSRSKSVKLVLREICDGAVGLLGAEGAWLAVMDDSTGEFLYAAANGEIANPIHRTKLSSGRPAEVSELLAQLLRDKQPIVIENASIEQLQPWVSGADNIKSACFVPVVFGSKTLAAFSIFHSNSNVFNNRNLELLEELASKASLAITNMNLKRNLLESESLRESILKSMDEAVIAISWSGEMVTANESALKMFNLKANEFNRRMFEDVFPSNSIIVEVVRDWLVTRANSLAVEGAIDANGRQLYISVKTSNVLFHKIPCLLLTITDKTVQKQMNASLEHASKLSLVGRIAAQIAHEINNPLTFISSQIQRCAAQDGQIDSNALKNLLPHIDRISSLIRKISEVGRKSPLVTRPENIHSIIASITSLVRDTESFSKIDLKFDVSPGLPLLNVDKNKIYQVILNLLINSADACPEGGEVIVSAQHKSVNIDAESGDFQADFVVVSVRDNGEGMEPERLRKIFEPFYTTKDPGKGTGLGLSVSLSIVSQHNGWIDVISEKGRGTEFMVYLPTLTSHEKAKQLRNRNSKPKDVVSSSFCR